VLLVYSGALVTYAHARLIAGCRAGFIASVSEAILVALMFTFLQFLEYKTSTLHINDSVYGSIFFLITGFHGFHVIVGGVFLFACLCRVSAKKNVTFTRQQHFGFLAAIWYWHFVDIVWLFLFYIIYL
jgi:cytochrome c oxidase subunit 3